MALFDFLRRKPAGESQGRQENETRLLMALYNGWDDTAAEIIRRGADVESSSYDKRPLHIAAEKGKDALVQLLIDHGASIRSQDSSGHFPVFYAAQECHYKTLRLLLREHARAWGSQADMNRVLYADEATALAKLFADIFVVANSGKHVLSSDDLPFSQEVFLAAYAIEIQTCEEHIRSSEYLNLLRQMSLFVFDFQTIDAVDVEKVRTINARLDRRKLHELDPDRDGEFLKEYFAMSLRYSKRASLQREAMSNYPYNYSAAESKSDQHR